MATNVFILLANLILLYLPNSDYSVCLLTSKQFIADRIFLVVDPRFNYVCHYITIFFIFPLCLIVREKLWEIKLSIAKPAAEHFCFICVSTFCHIFCMMYTISENEVIVQMTLYLQDRN